MWNGWCERPSSADEYIRKECHDTAHIRQRVYSSALIERLDQASHAIGQQMYVRQQAAVQQPGRTWQEAGRPAGDDSGPRAGDSSDPEDMDDGKFCTDVLIREA
jgi:hypothetical protein